MGYITQTELEKYLQRPLTSDEAASFAIIEGGAEAVINRYTGKSWGVAESATNRYFDGIENGYIYIDNATKITEVALLDYDGEDSTLLTDDEWQVYPYQEDNTAEGGITSIRTRNYRNYRGDRSIRVKAFWGSGAVPADVKLVALQMTAGIYSNPNGYKSQSIEGYSVTMDGTLPTDTKALLESLGQSVIVL